jgi:hypothetical protein
MRIAGQAMANLLKDMSKSGRKIKARSKCEFFDLRKPLKTPGLSVPKIEHF